ncbi:hypothetical protein GIB67_006132 [Kingdonia uniflora]|uniref:Pectinesterase inhibitor domain-containing protein n=1 Tax=Kingdonia uniflora TaxID=39325 RepID=A0A7J7LQ13_9MAGN|nr:hypothetical protein GIB67_006132 [Kingdonia uniflora]
MSVEEMNKLEPGEPWDFLLSNVQTWMSAALTNDETCLDGLNVVEEGPLKQGIVKRAMLIKKYTSISLMLVNFLKDGTIQHQSRGLQSHKDGSVHPNEGS